MKKWTLGLALLMPTTCVCLLSLLPWIWREPPLSVQQTPLLLLPLGAALLLWLWRGTELRTRLSSQRSRAHAVVLGLMLGTLAAVLGQAEGLSWKRDQLRILVWDISRSAERAGMSEQRRQSELALAEASMRDDDRLAVVEVAGRAELTLPPYKKGARSTRMSTELNRDATDLEAGVLRALGEVEAGGARVVLISDGIENHGDLLRATTQATTRGVPIDTLVLDYAPQADIELHAVHAPSRSSARQAFDLRVELSTPKHLQDAEIDLLIHRDGQPWMQRRARISAGHDVLQIPLREDDTGLHRYSVRLGASADSVAADYDQQDFFVDVIGPKTALVVGPDGPATAAFERWLRDTGFEVERSLGADGLENAADFAARDLLVWSNLPAHQLGKRRLMAMANAVSGAGTGLLLLGGPNAFGPGGYANTAIEEISPVSFDLKKDKNKPPLAEVITIDYSGSMSMLVDGQTKLDLANEAAARSASLLSPGDSVAVSHVDTEVRWTVPMTKITSQSQFDRVIRSVGPGGGGIYTDLALREAYRALRAEPPTSLRHVLLFADGDDAEQIAGCGQMAAQAARESITTSVISLGRGTDTPALEQISRLGEGRFYLVEDARTLPEVFSQETVMASRRAFREELVALSIGATAPYLHTKTPLALPPIEGYVVTLAKNGARVALLGAEQEPVLADWQRGVGKVGVLTTDLDGRWASSWNGDAQVAQLLTQLATSLAREPSPLGARLRAYTERGSVRLDAHWPGADPSATMVARVLGPGGDSVDVPLEEIGRGSFEAWTRPERSGVHLITLLERHGAQSGEQERLLSRTAITLGKASELSPRPSNRALLERVAAESGGVTRATLEDLFGGQRPAYAARADWRPGLLWAFGVQLLLMVALRRLAWPQSKPRVAATREAASPVQSLLAHTRLQRAEARSSTTLGPLGPVPGPPTQRPTPAVRASSGVTPAGTGAPEAPPKESTLSAAEQIAARRRRRS